MTDDRKLATDEPSPTVGEPPPPFEPDEDLISSIEKGRERRTDKP